MPKKSTPDEKRGKRVNISLTEELKDKLSMLAAIDRTTPTALAGKVLAAYVATREAELDVYRKTLEKIYKLQSGDRSAD